MKSRFVRTLPVVAAYLVGSGSIALADTSDVKGPAPVIVAKSGKHCKDDPNCFNRIHHAVKPVARVKPGQKFILETRDGLDSELDFNSTSADVAAINLNLCHPLTGPGLHRRSEARRRHRDNCGGHRARRVWFYDDRAGIWVPARCVSRSLHRPLGAEPP